MSAITLMHQRETAGVMGAITQRAIIINGAALRRTDHEAADKSRPESEGAGMSYIEREAVLDRLAKVDMDTHYGFTAGVQFGVDHAIQCIKETPAADVAPVRHGRWIEYDGDDAGFHYCSECKAQAFNYEENGEVIEVLSEWCPHCGALMDRKENESEVQ